uniref:Uncharacterized protein n=1 Tax=Rhizophora mucronata TaxID=61149 RepID=A0A2P2Q010_RHIMU
MLCQKKASEFEKSEQYTPKAKRGRGERDFRRKREKRQMYLPFLSNDFLFYLTFCF